MLLHTPAVAAFGIPCVRPNGVAVVEFWNVINQVADAKKSSATKACM